MFAYHATGITTLGLAGNGLSAVLVIYLAANVIISPTVWLRYNVLLLSLFVALTGTLIVNRGMTDPVDVIKYVSLYVLFLAGVVSPQRRSMTWVSALTIAVIPLVLLPFGSRVFVDSDVMAEASFSFFQTRNAATIYFTALAFCLARALGWFAIPLQMGACLLMGKVGPTVASGVAITAWNVRPNISSLAALVGLAIVGIIAYFVGLLQRAIDVIGPLYRDLLQLGPTKISMMSYADIVTSAGSTDVSGYFRIKHWLEIWQLFSNSGLEHILFGYGPGQSKFITTARLVPHNDYLRILVEFGVLNLLSFVSLIFIILFQLPDKITRSLFTVYVFYSFTDNMIDNFSSMMMLYAGAGLYVRRTWRTPSIVASSPVAVTRSHG